MKMVQDEARCEPAAQLYLDLMKKCLTRSIFPEAYRPIRSRPSAEYHPIAWAVYPFLAPLMEKLDIRLYRHAPVDRGAREDGRDWPAEADAMVGLKRLENLQYCVTEVIRKNVPGDLIETGVWRGGAR